MRVTRALLDLLEERQVFTQFTPGQRLREGEELYLHSTAELEPYIGLHAGHFFPRRMGAFSYSNAMLGTYFDIGRYCSIGQRVIWMAPEHPLEWVSSSSFSYDGARLQFVNAYLADRGIAGPLPQHVFDKALPTGVRIGNDVWIGVEAALGDDITIGDGAVVAGRAVVTSDVPPYAIVAGSPARVIRYRFPPDIVERLLALKWWRYGPDVIQSFDVRDPAGFASRMEDATLGLSELSLQPLRFAEIAAASRA